MYLTSLTYYNVVNLTTYLSHHHVLVSPPCVNNNTFGSDVYPVFTVLTQWCCTTYECMQLSELCYSCHCGIPHDIAKYKGIQVAAHYHSTGQYYIYAIKQRYKCFKRMYIALSCQMYAESKYLNYLCK